MAEPPKKRLIVDLERDIAIVGFVDKKILDESNAAIIGDELFALIEVEGHKNLVLDFTHVEYLSSVFLGKLFKLY
jgi:anti-anti-sigma regulatory factor